MVNLQIEQEQYFNFDFDFLSFICGFFCFDKSLIFLVKFLFTSAVKFYVFVVSSSTIFAAK